ncbi:MAG TPA: hypothetical protein DCP92_14830 [Nitrospiraceae bacterium]|jgi:hypothetical protein|nr:hypothetical protein [Nitrospiraceae bacterium]
MRNLLIAAPLLMLASCAVSDGHNFDFSHISKLDLHQMKDTEYNDLFAEPWREEKTTTGYARFDNVKYYYASENTFSGRGSVRILLLEFKDGQLNAYDYASSFDDDKTRIDLTNVSKVKIGVSTKEDVLIALGKPHGKALCPTEITGFKDKCDRVSETWGWGQYERYYTRIKQKRPKVTEVFVMFDKEGKVADLKTYDIIR